MKDLTRIRKDLRRYGIGMLQIRSGTQDPKEYARRVALVDKLLETAQLDLLRSLKAGKHGGGVSIEELIEDDRRSRIHRTAQDIVLRRPLWTAIAETLPKMGRARETRTRYALSLKKLRERVKGLTEHATVENLAKVDWRVLAETWPGSAADWNHLRRALSRFLTVMLGDKYHPFRRQLMTAIAAKAEPRGRVPDLTPADFWRVVDAAPAHARAAYVTLVATGMRVRSEYLRCDKSHLRPRTRQVVIPGTKTAGSSDVVRVDERLWPWVEAGVPAPLRYGWLRKHWQRACKAVGVEGVTLHDLRHCLGQWTTDEGVPEKAVQAMLRHATADMTRRYSRSREKGEVAAAMGRVLDRPEARPEIVNSMSGATD